MKYLHKKTRSCSGNSCNEEKQQRKRKKVTLIDSRVWRYQRRRCGRLDTENALSDCWPTATVNRTRSTALRHREEQCFCARLQASLVAVLVFRLHTVLSLLVDRLAGYKSMLNCWLRSNLYHFGPHSKLRVRVCAPAQHTMQVAINWQATVARDWQRSPSNDRNSHTAALIYSILGCTFINWPCENEFIYERKRVPTNTVNKCQ